MQSREKAPSSIDRRKTITQVIILRRRCDHKLTTSDHFATMADRTCTKCGQVFALPCRLKAHQGRKTPCDPILQRDEAKLAEAENKCRYCGRAFATKTNMYRHVRQSCKIAGSDKGMDKLMEHTLQRQLAEQNAKIDRLTTLLEQKLAVVPATGGLAAAPGPQQIITRNEGPTTINTGTVVNNTINIMPWDGERCISVGVKQVAAAFLENARLKEYSKLEEHQLSDPEIAPPYVTELLTDLARRAHADPAARNVYLNPKRADQVLVYLKTEKWEVRPLEEATRLLLDGVAASIHRITISDAERRQLPLEAQNALSMAGLVYEDERDEYVRRAKAPLAAHLANTRPGAP